MDHRHFLACLHLQPQLSVALLTSGQVYSPGNFKWIYSLIFEHTHSHVWSWRSLWWSTGWSWWSSGAPEDLLAGLHSDSKGPPGGAEGPVPNRVNSMSNLLHVVYLYQQHIDTAGASQYNKLNPICFCTWRNSIITENMSKDRLKVEEPSTANPPQTDPGF